MGELPPQIQNMIAQLQNVQQQLQMVMSQKIQLEASLKEVESAIQEVEKAGEDTPIFKSVGTVLVKSDKDSLLKEFKEKKDTIEIRIRTLSRQEEKLKERLQELQNKLKSMLGSVQAG
jgi:prefoldin beta subunit